MVVLSEDEALRVSEAFLSSLYGSEVYIRWQRLKQCMSFRTEREFVIWMLDCIDDLQRQHETSVFKSGLMTAGMGGLVVPPPHLLTNPPSMKTEDNIVSPVDPKLFGHGVMIGGLPGGRVLSGKMRNRMATLPESGVVMRNIPPPHPSVPPATLPNLISGRGVMVGEEMVVVEDDTEMMMREAEQVAVSSAESGGESIVFNNDKDEADSKEYSNTSGVGVVEVVRKDVEGDEEDDDGPKLLDDTLPNLTQPPPLLPEYGASVYEAGASGTDFVEHSVSNFYFDCDSPSPTPSPYYPGSGGSGGGSTGEGNGSPTPLNLTTAPIQPSHIPQSRQRTESKKRRQGPGGAVNTPGAIGKHYTCPHCDKLFSYASTRNQHVRVTHQRILTYACDHCDYVCGKKSNLTRHVVIRHRQPSPHQCQACFKCFPSPSSLNKHIMSCTALAISITNNNNTTTTTTTTSDNDDNSRSISDDDNVTTISGMNDSVAPTHELNLMMMR